MLLAWRSAVARHPAIAEALPAEQKLDLLRALTARFKLLPTWHEDNVFDQDERAAAASLVSAFFPAVNSSIVRGTKLSSVELHASLFNELIVRRNLSAERLAVQIEKRLPRLSVADLDIVQEWLDHAQPRDDYAPRMQSLMDAWRLQLSTDPAAQSRARPRL